MSTPTAAATLPAQPTRPGTGTVVLRTWLWGWLAIAQFVLDLVLAVPYLVVISLLIAGVASIPALLVGVPMAAIALVFCYGLGHFERVRLQAFTGVAVPPRPAPRARGSRWLTVALDARPWRAALHLLLVSLWGLLAGTVALVLTCVAFTLTLLPFYTGALPRGVLALPWGSAEVSARFWLAFVGLFGLVVLPLVARLAVAVDVLLVRWQLGGSRDVEMARLSARVETLTQTRVATVDSVEAERRRIERDLHDGPQQRLVAIAMDLGMARAKLDSDPEGARELIDKAHASSKEAITEMRQVARGIHPPVLTDRGLDAALSALAARSPVPVEVHVDVPRRPSPTVEAIAYFCVSEALTNVAKHAGATSARVDVVQVGGQLVATVSDDGRGGVDPSHGTGLIGLGQRVAAVDGELEVDSPAGRGTRLTVRLPLPATATNPYAPPYSPSAPQQL